MGCEILRCAQDDRIGFGCDTSLSPPHRTMNEITTQRGKRIHIISERELRDPFFQGDFVRAYCHIHGSDHQRSLSINRADGWGHCFNASCEATVLVAEWNPSLSSRLLSFRDHTGFTSAHSSPYPPEKQGPQIVQPVLLQPNTSRPAHWQREECQALLTLDSAMRTALIQSARARAYLRERRIPLEIAWAEEVAYLPTELLRLPEARSQRALLSRWTERLLFPLYTPSGQGYIGRSLWRWAPGVDEHKHKAILDHPRAPRRWIKTNPAGWFGYDPYQHPQTLIVVEGAFDRLALLAAGMRSTEVIALAGTAIHPDWFPGHVSTVILALDADAGGEHASARLVERLEQVGIQAVVCPPPQDWRGKDWSERWRTSGWAGIRPLFEAHAALTRKLPAAKRGA
jgi:hypothetical protein